MIVSSIESAESAVKHSVLLTSCAALGLSVAETSHQDIPPLHALISSIYHEYKFPESLRWYEEDPDLLVRESIVNPAQGVSHLIRSAKGSLVGAGILIPRLDPDTPSDAEISHLYLMPRYRGHGLGKVILDDLVTHAEALGYRGIYLVSRYELTQALGLYERNSFVRITNERYPDRPWLIEMRRALQRYL